MDKYLSSIINEYWEDFQKKKDYDFIVKPSIPIVWFGNMEAYLKSAFKVVTVAINPSNIEFEPTKFEIQEGKTNKFLRFPDAQRIYERGLLNENDKQVLFNMLNNYFEIKPYKKWFAWFERSFSFLRKDVSYYSNSGHNTALHIDVYTALATSPTWKKLSAPQKNSIINIDLFKKLLLYLNPDMIIFSGDYNVFSKVFSIDKCIPLDKYYYKSGKASYPYKILSFKAKEQLIIFGSNVQGNPLQLSENFIKNAFGEICSKHLRGE